MGVVGWRVPRNEKIVRTRCKSATTDENDHGLKKGSRDRMESDVCEARDNRDNRYNTSRLDSALEWKQRIRERRGWVHVMTISG